MGQRPDRHEGLPNQVIEGDRPEAPAIEGGIAVVPHHEHFVHANRERPFVGHLDIVEIRLVQGCAVDHDLIGAYLDALSRKADDSLDEVISPPGPYPDCLQHRPDHSFGDGFLDLGLARVAKNDDVTPLRLAPFLSELVHHHPVVHLDSGQHRFRWDPEWLDQESLDYDGNDESSEKETGQLRKERSPLRWSGALL